MAIDIKSFNPLNVIDTCSIWNLLSSKLLYQASKNMRCLFCCTRFVTYECLHKPRKNPTDKELKLQERFRKEKENGCFKEYHIGLEDLQDIEILEKRQRLSKGELSSIVFAKRTNQAFLTDDQGARILASQIMDEKMVQTIPQLFGWLIFSGILCDLDKDIIIEEHNEFERPLAKYFNKAYEMALEAQLVERLK